MIVDASKWSNTKLSPRFTHSGYITWHGFEKWLLVLNVFYQTHSNGKFPLCGAVNKSNQCLTYISTQMKVVKNLSHFIASKSCGTPGCRQKGLSLSGLSYQKDIHRIFKVMSSQQIISKLSQHFQNWSIICHILQPHTIKLVTNSRHQISCTNKQYRKIHSTVPYGL